MTDLSPETVGKLVALVRTMAGYERVYPKGEAAHGFVSEAVAIVAELPEPVDPDIKASRAAISGLSVRYDERGPNMEDIHDLALRAYKAGRVFETCHYEGEKS